MKKRFKVAIICDAGFLTGTYYYAVNIAEELSKLGCDVSLVTPVLLPDVKAKQLVLKWPFFKIPLIGRASWLLTLYFRLYKYNFDIIQSSWYGMMNLLPCNLYKDKLRITTLFDVAGDNKQFREGQLYLFIVTRILQPPHLRFNDFIITSSYRSKDQIIKLKGIASEKIGVTHLGVTDAFKRIKDKKMLSKAQKRLNLPERFILNVGGIKITRNSLRIVKAFSIIARKNPGISLVFSGKLDTTSKASKYHELISQEIRRMEAGVRNRILFLNNVPRDELKAVYSLATVFLMPSLEEGFGLPLLEAMRAGVPAVTSRISCMPEVAGDAALLCNPYDTRDIASKVERLLNDKALAKQLSSKAEARAKTFTWEKTAKETIRIYEQEWRKKFGSNS